MLGLVSVRMFVHSLVFLLCHCDFLRHPQAAAELGNHLGFCPNLEMVRKWGIAFTKRLEKAFFGNYLK
nr:MAG TPA: hypothetical protein [Caudoviricetes sp.]